MYTHAPEGYDCPLCGVVRGEETAFHTRSDVVYEDDVVMAYISPKWWVNNPGNVMVIPRAHVEHVYDIPDELLAKVQLLGKRVALGIKETYGSDGTSFRQHNEPAGGQDVWHYHLHVFPRWEGDELYLNHKNTRYVSAEERAPYAAKLRAYFERH